MNIVITNDDGYEAPGLRAIYQALCALGRVHIVAPKTQRSACSHMITLDRPITVERVNDNDLGYAYAVEGTPADCVRLAVLELIEEPIDLVVSGINRGANTGGYVLYSGTIAGAREGATLGLRSVAVSHAVRAGVEIDWPAAARVTARLLPELLAEDLPGPGFWSVNFPASLPADPANHIHRVPLATQPVPMTFARIAAGDGPVMRFAYEARYWFQDPEELSDFGTVASGGIAVTAIPLCGKF